ncbi:MAG: protein-export chaperone SecB [Alphaproteobacteria bacterium]
MSDNPQAPGAQPAQPGTDPNAPRIQINAQYLKDLSFENPNAPQSLAQQSGPPQIQVSVDVGARNFGDGRYEIELKINGEAKRDDQVAFMVELVYAGLFTLHNVDENTTRLVCLIECPRLLFPFARRVISDATRDGGFPPLLLEPIDFAALYRQQAEKQQAQAGNGGAAPDGDGTPPTS